MPANILKTNQPDDPSAYFLLKVLEEAVDNIRCYYLGKGTLEERIEGKKAVQWMREGRSKTFRAAALAAGCIGWNYDVFHQNCLNLINEIRHEAYLKSLKKNGH